MRIDTIDLEFQGASHVIASYVLHGPRGPVLFEPGPGSTLPKLLAGLRELGIEPGDLHDVLVTHIHLDHAGSAGWWARQGARIWVHEVGAPHLIDPAKLLTSASRIYGDRMETLWGEILPAPAEAVHAIADGAVIEAGGISITALSTPGHAWHHHVYCVGDIAFAGDAAGIMLPGNAWIDLPAPPPEFDLVTWKATLRKLRGAGLKTIYRTHFGPGTDVAAELDRFEQILDDGALWIREMLGVKLDRESMVREFTARMRSRAEESGSNPGDTTAYELANPREMSIDGIARYWRKQAAS